MDKDTAHLLIRQHLALIDEGIGPRDAAAADTGILERAAQAAGNDFDPHDLYEGRLISQERHETAHPRCPRC